MCYIYNGKNCCLVQILNRQHNIYLRESSNGRSLFAQYLKISLDANKVTILDRFATKLLLLNSQLRRLAAGILTFLLFIAYWQVVSPEQNKTNSSNSALCQIFAF